MYIDITKDNPIMSTPSKQSNIINIAKAAKAECAVNYARIGWYVLPLHGVVDGKCTCGDPDCKNPGKHPNSNLAPRGQKDATIDEGVIKDWFTRCPDGNIGILLSKSSLVAVDIDPRNGGILTMENLEDFHGNLTSDVLQYTGGGGEHRVFYLDEDSQLQLPGKLGPGVDLKRNGYIVVEPSTHASGSQYVWEDSSDPLKGVSPSPLPDWIRDLASPRSTGIIDLPPNFEPIDPAVERDLQSALPYIPNDDRDVWLEVGMAIHAECAGQEGFDLWDSWAATSAKHDPVDSYRVWKSFKNKGLHGLTVRTVFAKAQEKGWCNVAAAKTDEPAPQKLEVKPEQQIAPIPVAKLQQVQEWLSGLTEDYHPEISMAGALALGCVITGRKYRSTNANWTNLFFVVCGQSGIGKNYIQVGIERLLLSSGLGDKIAGDFYTHQSALYSALVKKPCHICISDEFGENFYEARKNNNANKATVFKALKKVYSSPDHIYKSEAYANSGEDKPPVLNPSITLVGLTTPLQFFSEIQTAHIEGGLINRLIVVNATPEAVRPRESVSDEPPKAISDWIQYVAQPVSIATGAEMKPVHVNVKFTDGAMELFNSFKSEQTQFIYRLAEYGLDSIPTRWREHAMRLATMLAACDDPNNPTIDVVKADWAISYVKMHGNRMLEKMYANVGESDYGQKLSKVKNFLMSAKSPKTWRELSRKFQSMQRRELTEIINHLVESGIVEERVNKPEGGGHPTKQYVYVG